ncbi:MAG: RimK/LysX family protein [Planctomycetota bacterium]
MSKRERGLACACVLGLALAVGFVAGQIWTRSQATPLLGQTATVRHPANGLAWLARVDTGATLSSIHCPIDRIDGLVEPPIANVGREVTLWLAGDDGTTLPVTTSIVERSLVRTESAVEHRYKVRLEISCGGATAFTLVTLNDRSHMRHKFLLGRDFLEGRFAVDVSQ